NVPVGRASGGDVLPISEAYIRAVIDARNADPGLERQLTVLTTSAGFPGDFRPMIGDSGLLHMQKVGSPRQALRAEQLGVAVVIASGYEMGGHTHAVPMHTFVLVPNVTEAVSVPVLLSGGARDGRTLPAALSPGAGGVRHGPRVKRKGGKRGRAPGEGPPYRRGRRGRRHHLPWRVQSGPRP